MSTFNITELLESIAPRIDRCHTLVARMLDIASNESLNDIPHKSGCYFKLFSFIQEDFSEIRRLLDVNSGTSNALSEPCRDALYIESYCGILVQKAGDQDHDRAAAVGLLEILIDNFSNDFPSAETLAKAHPLASWMADPLVNDWLHS